MKKRNLNETIGSWRIHTSTRYASEWSLARPLPLTDEEIEGTFEPFGDEGILHLGVTYPSSGTAKADVYVDAGTVNGFGLRPGDRVRGEADQTKGGLPKLQTIESINGRCPDESWERPEFAHLVPVYPDEQLQLSVAGSAAEGTMRDIDAYAPIGKGTRALVTAAGTGDRTRLLMQIALSIQTNNPEVELFVLQLGGSQSVLPRLQKRITSGEVICLNRKESPSCHIRAAALTIERAKRLVELGADAAVLLDGITLLSNSCARLCGSRQAADYHTRLLFGAARNIEHGGSLTIIASAFEGSRAETVSIMTDASTASIRLSQEYGGQSSLPRIDSERSWCRRDDLFHPDSGLDGEDDPEFADRW